VLVKAIQEKVKAFFENKEGSHDWEHIKRVWKLSIYLQKKEGGNKELIELCALLHDVSDHKYNGGDFSLGGDVAKQWIIDAGGSEALAHQVAIIVPKISFKGAKVEDEELPIEGRIVRDADRLDAIGAIGVARAFAYGGSKNRPLYSEGIKPVMHENKEDYLNSKSHTINHFYEKLLKIKGRMDTNTAKELAHTRHLFMEKYLEQFFLEWDVNID
tara:strand:- start:1001 stop:1645 length:645 start_codon:yes stop_codon:yes gene_type:complete